ncbi:MAG: MlaD family protein [Akkermansiaceae bacterium]
MSKKASPVAIGIFTLVGLILAAVAAVLFGVGRYFEQTHGILMYFDKSVNGLQVGSDVRFGGVRIGRVNSISVLVDLDENRQVIPVLVSLREKDLGLINTEAGGGIDFSSFQGVNKAVKDGLRARMKQQSLVTGALYVEFDIVPEEPGFVFRPKQDPPYPVVPTVGTEFDELIAGIADGIRTFNSLDLDGVIGDLRKAVVSATTQIDQLNVKEINDNLIGITADVRKITADDKLLSAVENLDAALVQIDQLATKANVGIDPLLTELQAVIARTDAGILRIEQATTELAQISSPRAPVVAQMQEVLRETQRASEALRSLTDDLRRNPASLLRGTAPPR